MVRKEVIMANIKVDSTVSGLATTDLRNVIKSVMREGNRIRSGSLMIIFLLRHHCTILLSENVIILIQYIMGKYIESYPRNRPWRLIEL
jgi:hypothetical protein